MAAARSRDTGEDAPRFRDRRDAGRQLAARLMGYAGDPALLVLALPRGGVPVAFEVALALSAPLDIFLVRKLGVPGHEELAMGAIAPGDVRVLNQALIHGLDIPDEMVEQVTRIERREMERRERLYRGSRPALDPRGQSVILIDDGLATGATMQAAVIALRRQDAARIVVAVPVAAPETRDAFRPEVDEIICAITPRHFSAISLWYDDFAQTTDEDVRDLLGRAMTARTATPLEPRSQS